MMNKNNTGEKLRKKLDKEMNQHREYVQSLPTNEAYDNYWKTIIYEEIYDAIDCGLDDNSLDNDEKKILLSQPEGKMFSNIYNELMEDDAYRSESFKDYTVLDSLRNKGFKNLQRNIEGNSK